MTLGRRCAVGAEERGELLAGTASRADRFVLVEFPTPWPHKAVDVFDPALKSALTTAADAASAKVLLVRRSGRRTGETRSWAIFDARAQRSLWGSWHHPEELRFVAESIGSDSSTWSTDPAVLVCTHARHDACCGLHGRPIAAVLAESHGDLAWECSHVGGHRLAGNVVLPLDGTYYGRVDVEVASTLVADHFGGTVTAANLRGFSWMDGPAQVVAVEAHRRWGPATSGSITKATCATLSAGRWRVELEADVPLPAAITAEVEEQVGPPAALSCGSSPEPTIQRVITSLDAEE